jgi:hypothetical protein
LLARSGSRPDSRTSARRAEQTITAARADAPELLERARDEAESTLAPARDDAKARVRQAEDEIGSLRDEAESTMRSLQVEIEAIAEQRRARLDDVREIPLRLEQLRREVDPPERSDAADAGDEPEESSGMRREF